MWKHGGLAAVAVAVLVIIALSLNALILVHSGRSTSMTTSGNEGRSRLAMLVHKVHRRMAAGEAPQVRTGGAEEPSPDPTKKPAAKAKKSEVAPPAPTASPTTVVEAPAAIVVVADEQPEKKAEPAVVVAAVASTTTNDEIAQAALAELAAAAATSDTAPVEQETSGPMREILSADKPKAPEATSAPSAAPASTSMPKTADKIAPATVTELGALWRPENCTPRKDGKPSKMHLWFTHVQEGQSALAPFSRAPAPLSQAPFCPLPAHFLWLNSSTAFLLFFFYSQRTHVRVPLPQDRLHQHPPGRWPRQPRRPPDGVRGLHRQVGRPLPPLLDDPAGPDRSRHLWYAWRPSLACRAHSMPKRKFSNETLRPSPPYQSTKSACAA